VRLPIPFGDHAQIRTYGRPDEWRLNAAFSNGQSPLLFQLIVSAQIGLARSPGIEAGIKNVLTSHRRKALRRSHFTLLLRQVICPTGSVREFLSSPRVKNKSLFTTPNQWLHYAIPSRYEGRFAIVTNVGMGCGGRGSVARETGSQGGFSRERSANARRRAMLKRTAKACGPGTRCWCQVGEGLSKAQPGARIMNSPATVARRIRRRGELAISC
jgi:hypothetical protein